MLAVAVSGCGRGDLPELGTVAGKVTMDGKDGVRIMQVVRPRKTMPIHYNDYDVFKSPLEDFAREVKARSFPGGEHCFGMPKDK